MLSTPTGYKRDYATLLLNKRANSDIDDWFLKCRDEGLYFNSLILTSSEEKSLYEMTNKKAIRLLYRATRDGFTHSAFHSKCDGKANTITIVKNNLNYVFGGYASKAWHSNDRWIEDGNAFIFSLRRNGISTNEKYKVAKPQYAYYGYSSSYLFQFGYGGDIFVEANSNTETGSWTNFGYSYQLPEGYTYGSESAQSYLSGKDRSWLTTEIEVFQLE